MEYMNKPVFKILKAVCMTNFAEIAKCQSLKFKEKIFFCFVSFSGGIFRSLALGAWHLTFPDSLDFHITLRPS